MRLNVKSQLIDMDIENKYWQNRQVSFTRLKQNDKSVAIWGFFYFKRFISTFSSSYHCMGFKQNGNLTEGWSWSHVAVKLI